MNTLIILAHPNLEESIANQRIVEQVTQSIENVEVRNIFQLYPDYKIDVKSEQEALVKADTVIFQYPFYWYNMPAILKVWFDEVFNFNFAYGPEGNKLKGKNFLLSFTVGGTQDAYSPLGFNHFRIPEFLKPMEQTAYLAQMNYIEPIYEHGMVYIPNVYNTKEAVEERSNQQAQRLIERIQSLSEMNPKGRIKAFAREWFEHFDSFSENGYFTKHLANTARLSFPEGEFIGHEGFNQWYAGMKKMLKPNSNHSIEALNVAANNDCYDVDLSVKVKGESLQGESIQINVKENWKVELTRDGRIKIHEYLVKTIN